MPLAETETRTPGGNGFEVTPVIVIACEFELLLCVNAETDDIVMGFGEKLVLRLTESDSASTGSCDTATLPVLSDKPTYTNGGRENVTGDAATVLTDVQLPTTNCLIGLETDRSAESASIPTALATTLTVTLGTLDVSWTTGTGHTTRLLVRATVTTSPSIAGAAERLMVTAVVVPRSAFGADVAVTYCTG